jgi:hypothetical protein
MGKGAALVFLLLGVIARLVFPGDVSFINDEAKFLEIAYKANQSGDLFNLGLEGAKGVKYGPLSIYWFRFLLFLTHDLFWVSTLNIVLILVGTLLGLYLLAKELKIDFVRVSAITLLSPFLWFYGRNLWDNSINQVLVIYTVYFYVRFFNSHKVLDLLGASLILNGMFHIHPMSLSIGLAFFFHFIIFTKTYSKKLFIGVVGTVMINIAVASPYLCYFLPALLDSDKEPLRRPLRSFTNSFFIAQVFSTFKFSYFLGKEWWFKFSKIGGYLMFFVGLFSWISYLAFGSSLVKYFKERNYSNVGLSLSIIAIFSQAIMYCFLKIYGHPHYIALNWVFGLILIYFALVNYPKLFILYESSLVVLLSFIIFNIHFFNGSRSFHYGQTLENQIEVARKLNDYQAGKIKSYAFHPQAFPHTLQFIRKMLGKVDGNESVEIFYSNRDNDNDAHISVRKASL